MTPTPRFPRQTGKRERLSSAKALTGADVGALSEHELATPKQSGLAPRMPSDRPGERTRLPSEVRSRLPDDPEEAARDHRVSAMRELYAAGDTDAALFIAQTIDPSPSGYVSLVAETVRPPAMPLDVESPVHGALDWQGIKLRGAPSVVRRRDEIARLPLDHRAGFLLTHIDGVSTTDEILDVCAMPESEAIGILRELLAMGVIAFERSR